MKALILISLLFTLCSFIAKPPCDFNLHLRMDKRLIEIKDSLGTTDTLILYRHWTVTNGELGYARVFEKREGSVYRKELNYNHSNHVVDEFPWTACDPENDPFVSLRKAMKQEKAELTPGSVRLSHDGLHTVQVYFRDSLTYCDELRNMEVRVNGHLSRVRFINSLRDSTQNQGVLVRTITRTNGPKYYLKGKPVFSKDPKVNRRLKREYNKRRKNK